VAGRPDPKLAAELRARLHEFFTDEQVETLEGIWQVNADTLAETHRLTRGLGRLLRRGLGLLLLVLVVIGAWNYSLQGQARSNAKHTAAVALAQAKQAEAETRRYAQAVQTSRYDGAFVACQATNTKHKKELAALAPLAAAPLPGHFNLQNVVEAGWPLRDGKNGRLTCQQYARSEVKLKLGTAKENR
jgi:hypothetical protein